MRDGRILWTRTEYLDKGADFGHTLWAIRPNGDHPELVFGNDTPYCYGHAREVPGSGELVVFCGALFGASLGFLWYNSYPAEIFMGDTGSLFLGGAIGLAIGPLIYIRLSQTWRRTSIITGTLAVIGGAGVDSHSIRLRNSGFKMGLDVFTREID